MKISQLAQVTGLSAHTIRYYERIGLLPRPHRDDGGRRDYDASILAWVAFLKRLKSTNMPIRDMQLYARLREEGDQTSAKRRKLLEAHRENLKAQIADLSESLTALDEKIETYYEMERGQADEN